MFFIFSVKVTSRLNNMVLNSYIRFNTLALTNPITKEIAELFKVSVLHFFKGKIRKFKTVKYGFVFEQKMALFCKNPVCSARTFFLFSNPDLLYPATSNGPYKTVAKRERKKFC